MNFTKMQERLLVRMYHVTMNGVGDGNQFLGSGIYFIDFIFEICPASIPKNLVSKLLEGLVDDGFAIEHDPEWNFQNQCKRSVFGLTSKGLKHIEQLVRTGEFGDREVYDAFEEDTEWVSHLELNENGNYAPNTGTAPASDRSVPLDHNSQDYIDAVSALDEAIQEFTNDHNLDNELGHEKPALIKALEAGRMLLEDTVVNFAIGTALLLEPLKRIAAKYEHALVGALAGTALGLIAKLLA